QRRRHGDAERVGGLEVDDELILGRRLHRQVGRFLALEDAIDVSCRASVLIDRISSIRNQAAAGDKTTLEENRRQLVPGRKGDDQSERRPRQRPPRHDQAAIRGAREGRSGALDLADVAQIEWPYIHPKRWCHRLNDSKPADPGFARLALAFLWCGGGK